MGGEVEKKGREEVGAVVRAVVWGQRLLVSTVQFPRSRARNTQGRMEAAAAVEVTQTDRHTRTHMRAHTRPLTWRLPLPSRSYFLNSLLQCPPTVRSVSSCLQMALTTCQVCVCVGDGGAGREWDVAVCVSGGGG